MLDNRSCEVSLGPNPQLYIREGVTKGCDVLAFLVISFKLSVFARGREELSVGMSRLLALHVGNYKM